MVDPRELFPAIPPTLDSPPPVRELRCHFSEKKAMALLYRLEKCTRELAELTRGVTELTNQFQERWSQKSR